MGARGQKHVALVPNLAEPYDLQVMAGISKHVRERANWSVYVPPDPVHQVAMLENWRGDGIIANMDDPSLASVIRKKGVPAVGFGGGASFTTSRINYLATDNRAIGALGAQHLLERGFTRFGYCAMPRSARYQPWSRDRGAAFREEVEREGFSCSLFSASAEVSLDWDQLLKALIQSIESFDFPSNFMPAYYLRALHVLEACRALQVRVPDELAVLGVDNQEVICELAEPKLSSIVQGGWQVGAMASERLQVMK